MSSINSFLIQSGFRSLSKGHWLNTKTAVIVKVNNGELELISKPKEVKGLVVGYAQHIQNFRSKNPKNEQHSTQVLKQFNEFSPFKYIRWG